MLFYWVKKIKSSKYTKALLNASKEVGLESNAEETKYMFMSRHQVTKTIVQK
jgi:hypothetical protein